MPRTADPHVRVALVERAAEMLARREPVTLRALVESVGTSTMAVYTHFGDMAGLWRAVRQEGFTRLTARLSRVQETSDPVRDLMACGAAYTSNALANPALYRTMFDTAAELEDPAGAAAGFEVLSACAARARRSDRFAPGCEPAEVATQLWAAGHGLAMLVLTGVLPADQLPRHATALAQALFVGAGDDPVRCRRSVAEGWASSWSP